MKQKQLKLDILDLFVKRNIFLIFAVWNILLKLPSFAHLQELSKRTLAIIRVQW